MDAFNYPEDFINEIKKEFPQNAEMHQAVESGKEDLANLLLCEYNHYSKLSVSAKAVKVRIDIGKLSHSSAQAAEDFNNRLKFLEEKKERVLRLSMMLYAILDFNTADSLPEHS
ncbi:MAG: hypothetical protein KW793_00675 [Candidatus Doudnabacteria bacterium]|nr:hypothetical protein [Candidatus Doudnabacteria bacterium]